MAEKMFFIQTFITCLLAEAEARLAQVSGSLGFFDELIRGLDFKF